MASAIFSRRFALLIGVNAYQSDGSRTGEDDSPVTLRNLSGCVNDVQAMQTFLEKKIGFTSISILTSTPSTDPGVPKEPPDALPTFDNIRRKFEEVIKDAAADDLFFFHFSGHGARLKTTSQSPQDGREEDPSLMTVDYCCGKPAVRGWQLNSWLKRLYDKKVQVIVSLDSCFSAGAWRDEGNSRSPEDWKLPMNLPADENEDEGVYQEGTGERGSRDGFMDASWDLNPDQFTLMTACRSDQMAQEKHLDGKAHGVYTHAMLQYLNNNWPRVSTYRTLRDQIASQITGRNPQDSQVYGRDRLVILGNKEPFSVAPIVFRWQGDHAVLPVGRLHGIQKGAQFTTFGSDVPSLFLVDQVNNLSCIARETAALEKEPPRSNEVILQRWSMGEQPMRVVVGSDFEDRFKELLLAGLQDRLHGDINLVESEDGSSSAITFKFSKANDGGAEIFGPVSTVGYKGPVRGLIFKGKSTEEQATESAFILAHLVRFGQILSLRDEASTTAKPFQVAFGRVGTSSSELFLHGEQVKYTVRNTTNKELYYTLIILSPGFNITQLFPRRDGVEVLRPGKSKTISFKLQVPSELHGYPTSGREDAHRDILRTVVTTTQVPSFKSLEVPDVWNASQGSSLEHTVRDAKLISSGQPRFKWWIDDVEIRTVLSGA